MVSVSPCTQNLIQPMLEREPGEKKRSLTDCPCFFAFKEINNGHLEECFRVKVKINVKHPTGVPLSLWIPLRALSEDPLPSSTCLHCMVSRRLCKLPFLCLWGCYPDQRIAVLVHVLVSHTLQLPAVYSPNSSKLKKGIVNKALWMGVGGGCLHS